ncbi:AraC family transcriptional regulator [Nitratidesulfovibrio liaohensis]|uniref:AraC family transcriptional regulator n=1 Tax=Nitratidesulfovibrio liaohensis TaxID=2604158 RepID=UPI0014218C6A|nr:GyrI-like domain-containing protein [Nitratidesulfovibrio liaohensis]NHZ47708.1 AraC family transcriptional regulator [Nitratidesulfovibrio liaohensis]
MTRSPFDTSPESIPEATAGIAPSTGLSAGPFGVDIAGQGASPTPSTGVFADYAPPGTDTAFGLPRPESLPLREDTLRRYEARINRVIDYIVADPARDFTLDELAGAAPFSPFHFHRIFAGLVGETLHAFIRRLRMDRAANMLAFAPALSVTDVAMYCGFSSSQNFARAFRERFDMTPSEYRRRRHYQTGADREGAHGLLADPFRAHAGNGKARNAPPGGTVYESSLYNEAAGHNEAAGRDGATGPVAQHPESPDTPVLSGTVPPHGDMPWFPDGPPHVRLDPDSARSDAMNVEVTEKPAYRVAYLRHIGPYAGETIGPVWGRLMAWAGQRGLMRPGVPGFGVSWDNPEVTPPENCRYDACIAIGPEVDALELAEAGISVQTLPGGLYAEYRSMIPCDGFFRAWNDMYTQWLPASGWQCDDRPGYELYHDMLGCPPEGPWDVGICVAVRPL